MPASTTTNFTGISTPGIEQIADTLGAAVSPFGDLKTATRIPVIELKSNYGLSALRDVTTVTGSGAVTNNGVENLLSTGTTTASKAQLDSAERGRYIPGYEADAGVGVRFDHTFTGTQVAQWGYFDADNGLGFGIDATGLYVFILRSGVYNKIYRDDWNVDKADGLGESGATLTLSKGNIFSVNFVWYGYGVVEFVVFLQNSQGKQVRVVLHRFSPSENTSVANPNLPVSVWVDNGNTTEDIDVYVGGRQFSISAVYRTNQRINGQEVFAKTGIGETYLPIISFRKKASFKSVSLKIGGYDMLVDADMAYQIRLGGTLTGASFTTPTNTTAAETACEADTTASAITGGNILYKGMINASGTGNNTGGAKYGDLNYDVPGEQIITLCARRITGTNATMSMVLRWLEDW